MHWRLLLVCLCLPLSVAADVSLANQGSSSTRERRSQPAPCTDCQAPVITQNPRNHSLTEYARVQFKCKVRGKPAPDVSWMHGGSIITPKGSSGFTVQFNARKLVSKLVIERARLKDAGLYTCLAINSLGRAQSSPAVLEVKEDKPPPSPTPWAQPTKDAQPKNQLCIHYHNSTCRNVLNPRLRISVKSVAHFLYTEKQLQQTYKTISVQYRVSATCKPYVLPLLCHHNFPYCSEALPGTLKLICRSACHALQDDLCHADYLAAKQDQYMRELLPNCAELPSRDCLGLNDLVTKATMRPPTIALKDKSTGAGTRSMLNAEVDQEDNCFIGQDDYRGVVNVSVSNERCLPWNGLQSFSDANYPQLFGHNYCRNPGTRRDRPWCFVDVNGKEEMAYCDIPKCILPAKVEVISILWTIIPCLVFALALSLAIIMVAWRRHKHDIYLSPVSPPTMTMMPKIPSKISELKREDICALRLFGEGSFGSVYAAEYVGSVNGRPATKVVAVKVLMDKGMPCQTKDFLKEAETMARFKHENVASLLGSISKDGPLCLVYEYSEFGDLHEYLLMHSPNFSGAHATGECEPLDGVDLLAIGVQIAKGMEYLTSQSYVHRDLATRNCFVNDDGIVKISWFSGLRDVYAGDYYRVPSHPPLPVRWMAPESLDSSTFTSASDAWSYGVTLWEIFSYGLQPHFGFCNQDVAVRVRNGCRLSCPENCSQRVHAIMLDCWELNPELRPTFSQLVLRLTALSKGGSCGRSSRVTNGHANGRTGSVASSVASSHSMTRANHGISPSIRSSHPSGYGKPSSLLSVPQSTHSMTQSMLDCQLPRHHHNPPLPYDRVIDGYSLPRGGSGSGMRQAQLCHSYESSLASYQGSAPSCNSSCRSCGDNVPCEPRYLYA